MCRVAAISTTSTVLKQMEHKTVALSSEEKIISVNIKVLERRKIYNLINFNVFYSKQDENKERQTIDIL